jgi:translation initiation factor IF-2
MARGNKRVRATTVVYATPAHEPSATGVEGQRVLPAGGHVPPAAARRTHPSGRPGTRRRHRFRMARFACRPRGGSSAGYRPEPEGARASPFALSRARRPGRVRAHRPGPRDPAIRPHPGQSSVPSLGRPRRAQRPGGPTRARWGAGRLSGERATAARASRAPWTRGSGVRCRFLPPIAGADEGPARALGPPGRAGAYGRGAPSRGGVAPGDGAAPPRYHRARPRGWARSRRRRWNAFIRGAGAGAPPIVSTDTTSREGSNRSTTSPTESR